MPYCILDKAGGQFLKLEGSVTIVHALDLTARLRDRMDDAAVVGVDTKALEDIDTCVLQMLCSLRKTFPALSFDDPSDAFLRAVERCGLRRELLTAREIS